MTKQWSTPGPRAIYPELCDSPSLGRCGILANALFPRLIAMADDQGRLVGDARSILVTCMGRLLEQVTVTSVHDALEELGEAGMLELYTIDEQQYLQLTQWWRWQNGQRRAYPSRWPSPKGWADLIYGCAAGSANSFEEALAGSPRRNAAIRGIPPQSAAVRGNPPPRAQAHTQAPAHAPVLPGRANANAVPPGRARATGSGANGAPAGGLRASAQAVIDNPNASEEARAGARAMLDLESRSGR